MYFDYVKWIVFLDWKLKNLVGSWFGTAICADWQ